MKKLLNSKQKLTLAKLIGLCGGLVCKFLGTPLEIYIILILEVLTGGSNKGFVKYLEAAIARFLGGVGANNPNFKYCYGTSFYIITKLVESVFKRYCEHSRYKWPLEHLQFDIAVTRQFIMADNYSDFVKDDKDPGNIGICVLYRLFETYSKFVLQRNQRFSIARDMVKVNDVGTILEALCPEDPAFLFIHSNHGNINREINSLRDNNKMVVDDDLADIFIEIIVNEIDFWSYIFENNGTKFLGELGEGCLNREKEVKTFYLSDLEVIEAEGDKAVAKGDYVRATKMFESFIRASDRYRSAVGITRSYRYSIVKERIKWLKESQ